MVEAIRSFFEIKKSIDLGQRLFLLGVFFLPSALPIGGLFLLCALFISFLYKPKKSLKDNWNYIFYFCLFIIILSTINITILGTPNELVDYDKNLIWLNLFNWIPIFFAYLGFQIYLVDEKQRIIFQKYLIAGTLPVIFSCIIQKFFKVYGPFETLYGTIVWFNYKLSNEQIFRITGLFNNPNYLGTWLTLCLPFSISLLKKESLLFPNKIFLYVINFLVLYFSFLTGSRNALLGIIITFICLINFKKVIYFICIFSFTLFIIIFLIPNSIEFSSLINLDPATLTKYSEIDLTFSSPRMIIWKSAISLISERPFTGWGASTFSYMFNDQGFIAIPFKHMQSNHTHNMILELAYNFGIPLSILSTLSVSIICFSVLKKIYDSFQKNSFYLPWILSFGILLISQLTDITYYDGKISILFCLLFAGTRNIMFEIKNKENSSNDISPII